MTGNVTSGALDAERAADALRESEERFRGTFENAAHGMALVSPEGRWLRVNAALVEMLGYTEPELLATDFQAITHPDDLDADLTQVAALLAGDIQSYHMEKRYLRKDGQVIWILLSVSLLRAADGTPIHFVSQILDFTQRLQAEEALRESEFRHRILADNVVDIITWLRPDGTRLYISPSVRQILGYTPDELIGKNHLAIDHPDDSPLLKKAMDLVLGGAPSAEATTRKRTRDGGYVWCDIKLSAVRNAATGEIESIIAVSRDATKRRALEDELAQARDRADQASQAKSDFLATMSHELRTPLNGVLGFADLLLDGELDSEQRRKAMLLRDAGKSLLAIIGDILDVSKVEAGKLDLERTPFDLRNVVDGAVTILASQAAAKRVTIKADVAPALPEWVEGDPTRLRQILLNLISNAVKFTEQGQVGIRVRRDPGGKPSALRFDVTDSGIGIAADRRHLLFEPFSQTKSSVNREYGGTGLGLAISKRLVEAMGGDIGVDSIEGKGSTFTFTIILPSVAAPRVSADAKVPHPSQAPIRILVAEDVMINQIVIDAMLKTAGHEVVLVGNGAEAVDTVARGKFDLVLMDLEMPLMDGVQAAVLIRAQAGPGRDIPIVALTADASTDGVARSQAAGMNDHLTKPIDRVALLRAIARWSGQTPDMPVPAAPPPAATINEPLIADLETRIGQKKLAMLMNAMRQQISTSVAALSDAPTREVIVQQTHNMVATAGSLGLIDLMTRSRTLMDVTRQGGENVAPLIAAFLQAASLADAAIEARYG